MPSPTHTSPIDRPLASGRHWRTPRISRRYAIFAIGALAFSLALFQRSTLAAIAGQLMAQFDLTASQLGALGSLYFYPYALMQIPIGILVDRYGARRLMAASLVLASIGGLLFATARDYTGLMIGRAVIGVGFCAVFIPSQRLMAGWLPAKDLALWNGLFLSIAGLGTFAAGRPLVEAADRYGWSSPLMGAALLTAAMAVLVGVVVRDEPRPSQRPLSTIVPAGEPAKRLGLSAVLRSPGLYLLGLGGFLLYGAHVGFQSVWAGPYLNDVYHLPTAPRGNLLMLLQLGHLAGSLSMGWVADRVLHSRARAVTLGCIAYGILWIPLAVWTGDFSLGVLSAFYVSFGFTYTSYLLVFPIARAQFPPEVASLAQAVVNLMAMTGGAVVQQIFGLVLDRFTAVDGVYPVEAYQWAFRVGVMIVFVGVIFLTVGARMRPARR